MSRAAGRVARCAPRLTPARARALGLVAGALADQVWGDPRRWHPVAGFGQAAVALERRLYRRHRGAGVVHHLIAVGGVLALASAAQQAARARPPILLTLTAASTWTVLGGRTLHREARAVSALLDADDLPAARRRVSHLVGRRTENLSAPEVVRAVVESVAENTADAVVAPLVWGAVSGVPGLLGYRAVNTLDAMVGHRTERYREFGWCSARSDDLANLVPARLCAGLTVLLAPTVGGDPVAALQAWRRDAPAHPSPNAGVVEASLAGALGVRLGGSNQYDDQVEDRGWLGAGEPVTRADLEPALRLCARVGWASVLLAAVFAAAGPTARLSPVRRWLQAA